MGKSILLRSYTIHHGGRKMMTHPQLNKSILSQTAISYLRFLAKVRIDYLELPVIQTGPGAVIGSGRWVPSVPTHPRHIIISLPSDVDSQWKVIQDVELPTNPDFLGAGLIQDMSIEIMEESFKNAVKAQKPHRIDLGGIEADCLRIECDQEYPVWQNHGEVNGGPFNVPYGILHNLMAFGEQFEQPADPEYQLKLRKGIFDPVPPEGMRIDIHNPLEIKFIGENLEIAFSLIRPMMTHFAWNIFENVRGAVNRLRFNSRLDSVFGSNGPFFVTRLGNYSAQNMSGEVSVIGNQVIYRDIDTGCGIRINAKFIVKSDSIIIDLEQIADRDVSLIEGETWRLLWNMRAGMTSVAGFPTTKQGRNGYVDLPARIAADQGGCLSVNRLQGNGFLHTESYRQDETRSCGFLLAIPENDTCQMKALKGVSKSVFQLQLSSLLPVSQAQISSLSDGIKKCWTAGFSAFRPEFGGFSNNAISCNCHVNQHVGFDFAAFTAKATDGFNPLDLVKFSIGRALMDGGGYGYHRMLYMDSDPVLISGAARIFQLTADQNWIEQVSPGIIAAVKRIISNFDEKEGMIVCRSLSGNSGTHRWSSNGMDCIGFGNIDAYVNAWSFRAIKNSSFLCRLLGEEELSKRCTEVNEKLSENYARQLINPETGWVSGWKSRDGKLHDYGFLWINGVACAFKLLRDNEAKVALQNLETKRMEVFPESGYLGLPLNLIPIMTEDHMMKQWYYLQPTYENYTDGALSPMVNYYIRALSIYGYKSEAASIVDSLEQGFADGKFHGPYGTGKEFTTWTGADSGYEGTFGLNSSPLYAIAVERGIITPTKPEWWIEE